MTTVHPADSKPPAPFAGLLLAACLSIALLAISIARLAGDMGSTTFNLDLARSALNVPIWRSKLGLNLVLFVLALAALHLAFGMLCWLLARISEHALPGLHWRRRDWLLLWYLAGVVWILIANASQYPKSSLGEPYQGFVAARAFGMSPLGFVTFLLLGATAAVLVLAMIRTATHRAALVFAGTAMIGVVAAASLSTDPPTSVDLSRPHIVLLGIDSLRPDAIDAATTPNLRAFMDGAVQMADTVTPLARTFPSWASILTGRHPHTTGAYMNLLPRELINEGTTLPERLQAHGYRAYYAIDETRFSNIDASYGFNQTVTPAMGGSDFMLARIADTPLSNLVMNTRLGGLLFPHVHANRAASIQYDPDSFVRRIGRELSFQQPSFLAVHLTLPHWPFIWATASTDPHRNSQEELYQESLKRADRQFGDLLALLEQKGVLRNALVITLSDHGEALGHADDFMADAYPTRDKHEIEYQHWGHGTSVFSPTQYRVALGFRAYGAANNRLDAAGVRHEPVSLVDIAPTILELLHIESSDSFDGISLASLLQPGAEHAQDFTTRIRFTESEYNPQGFDSREFTTSQLTAAAHVYQLDALTDRITVRTDMLSSIMSSRQYAALLGNRVMAAAVPGPGSDGSHALVLVPLLRHSDASVLQSEEAVADSDERLLRQALQQRFGISLPE